MYKLAELVKERLDAYLEDEKISNMQVVTNLADAELGSDSLLITVRVRFYMSLAPEEEEESS
jgi:hypothetical protein